MILLLELRKLRNSMPRYVSMAEKSRCINLMLEKDPQGNQVYSQNDIESITNLSRPYIRKLARLMNHQFPRNGIERKGTLCVCENCQVFFRRPQSKVIRA